MARPTSSGPGSTKAGRSRAVSHQPRIISSTALSAAARSAGETCPGAPARRASATAVSPVEPTLRRAEGERLGERHEEQDEQDDREDGLGVELLAGDIEQVTDAGIAAEQLGREHRLPGDAEAGAQGRE